MLKLKTITQKLILFLVIIGFGGQLFQPLTAGIPLVITVCAKEAFVTLSLFSVALYNYLQGDKNSFKLDLDLRKQIAIQPCIPSKSAKTASENNYVLTVHTNQSTDRIRQVQTAKNIEDGTTLFLTKETNTEFAALKKSSATTNISSQEAKSTQSLSSVNYKKNTAIERWVNLSLNINDQKAHLFGSGKTNITISANLNKPQDAKTLYIQKNIVAYNRILQENLQQQLASEIVQLKVLILNCLDYTNKATILDSLDKIANSSEHFKTIAQVPYLHDTLLEPAKKLLHVWLHEDGVLRTGYQVGFEKEIARIVAQSLLPFASNYKQYESIIVKLKEDNFPGALSLYNELLEQKNETSNILGKSAAIISDAVDTTTSFVGSIKKIFTDASTIEQKFLQHPANKVLRHIIQLQAREQWQEAEAVAYDYLELNTAKEINGIFQEILYQNGYINNVSKKYSRDPLFTSFIENVQSKKINYQDANECLKVRHERKNDILNHLHIKKVSPLTEKLAYNITSLFYDPVALSEYLSCLAQDHTSPDVMTTYKDFFDSNGICKVIHYDRAALQNISIPSSIGTIKNTQARTLLNTLIKIETIDPVVKQQVKQALDLVVASCSSDALSSEYLKLGQKICDALVYPHADKTILECGNFAELNKSQDEKILKTLTTLSASTIAQSLDSSKYSKSDKNQMRTALSKIDEVRALLSKQQYDAAKALGAVVATYLCIKSLPQLNYLSEKLQDVCADPEEKYGLVFYHEPQQQKVPSTPQAANENDPANQDPDKEPEKDKNDPLKQAGTASAAAEAARRANQDQGNNNDRPAAQSQPATSNSNTIRRSVDMSNGKTIKNFEIKEGNIQHAFSIDHKDKGILNLGIGKNDDAIKENILESAINIAKNADNKGLLKIGTNRLVGCINNKEATISIHIDKQGTVQSLNIFAGHSNRNTLNTINFGNYNG